MAEPRKLAELLPEVAAAIAVKRERAAAGPRSPYCVILFMSGPCEEYPDVPCPMEVIYEPGMTRDDCERIMQAALTFAPWTRPPMVMVSDRHAWMV